MAHDLKYYRFCRDVGGGADPFLSQLIIVSGYLYQFIAPTGGPWNRAELFPHMQQSAVEVTCMMMTDFVFLSNCMFASPSTQRNILLTQTR